MKYIENKLGRQLILILVIIFDIVLITTLFIIPRMLAPIYESSVYTSLKNPTEIISKDLEGRNISNEIAYFYIAENRTYISDNYKKIVNAPVSDVINSLTDEYGSFEINGKMYYYYTLRDSNSGDLKVSIANESYLSKIKNNFLATVMALFLLAFLLIIFIVFLWSSMIVRKIEKLKQKVDNIDNDNFNHNINFRLDDEIKSLEKSIEDARVSLKMQ